MIKIEVGDQMVEYQRGNWELNTRSVKSQQYLELFNFSLVIRQ